VLHDGVHSHAFHAEPSSGTICSRSARLADVASPGPTREWTSPLTSRVVEPRLRRSRATRAGSRTHLSPRALCGDAERPRARATAAEPGGGSGSTRCVRTSPGPVGNLRVPAERRGGGLVAPVPATGVGRPSTGDVLEDRASPSPGRHDRDRARVIVRRDDAECAVFRSRTWPGVGRSSYVYAELQLPRRRPILPTPRSPTCSSRPSSSPISAALLATRRVVARDTPDCGHTVVVEGQPARGAQYETDRARPGPGRTIRTPMSVIDGRPCRIPRGPCSIPSSAETPDRLAPESAPGSSSPPWSPRRAAAVPWPTSTATRDLERAVTLAGPRRRSAPPPGIDGTKPPVPGSREPDLTPTGDARAPDVLRRNTAARRPFGPPDLGRSPYHPRAHRRAGGSRMFASSSARTSTGA